MILGGENRGLEGEVDGSRTTIDDLFRRAGVRGSATPALIDPPNRTSFTGGAPHQLTYAQADRAISALAAKLCRLGLQTDTVVAIQLPNTVENIVTLLAVLRAGMIAVPLPLLWRRTEMIAALGNIGAKAIITSSRIGAVAHAEVAMQVAAELFPIRFICAFGDDLPDGVLPLDDVFATDHTAIVPRSSRSGHAADHVAAVTFDVTTDGFVPVARSHMELIAGGSAVFREAGSAENARILSAIPPCSFAGFAVAVLPWLLGGGTLSLHHGFDPASFAVQARDGDTIVLPGPALTALADAGCLGGDTNSIVALWRAPEQLATSVTANAPWRGSAALVDVASFGEAGLLALRRGPDGLPADIPHGCVDGPRATGSIALAACETARGKNGTLTLRGPMVPLHAFPPGADQDHDPHLNTDESGFVDTGFTCRLEHEAQTLVVTGPPGGITAIGGYRFLTRNIESQVSAVDPAATVVALPGGILAQRLAGSAIDNTSVGAQLNENGANPLVAGAFRPRGNANAA